MSDSLSMADSIRAAISAESLAIATDDQFFSDGTEENLTAATANTYLNIETTTTGTQPPLFLGAGYSLIENVNDTGGIVATGTDGSTTAEFYQGDAGGQSFFTGTGNVFVAMTGFGNTVTTPVTGGGTYTIATGLADATGDQTLLAAAASVGGVEQGNTIAAASGDYSIAAGLGANVISLGSGNDTVASEGSDTILGGTGTADIYGTGAASIFGGTGAMNFYGQGGTAIVIAAADTMSGPTAVFGGSDAVTVFGGGGDISAFGGTGGPNVLVGGAATSVLVGAGAGDLLVASGAGTSTLVAGTGNETLFGGGATGVTNFFAGGAGSNDTIVTGSSNDYVQFGDGNSTVFGSTGTDLYGLVDSSVSGASSDVVVGFDASQDFFALQGFDSSTTGSFVFANDVSVVNGSTFIQLPDNATIDLYGVTNLTASNFV